MRLARLDDKGVFTLAPVRRPRAAINNDQAVIRARRRDRDAL